MQREEIITQHEAAMLAAASELFGAADDGWALVPEYEGCAHLVYSYTHQGQPRVLRVSFRPDRTVDQITAELHFVNDLAVHGVRVSTPVCLEIGQPWQRSRSTACHFIWSRWW